MGPSRVGDDVINGIVIIKRLLHCLKGSNKSRGGGGLGADMRMCENLGWSCRARLSLEVRSMKEVQAWGVTWPRNQITALGSGLPFMEVGEFLGFGGEGGGGGEGCVGADTLTASAKLLREEECHELNRLLKQSEDLLMRLVT